MIAADISEEYKKICKSVSNQMLFKGGATEVSISIVIEVVTSVLSLKDDGMRIYAIEQDLAKEYPDVRFDFHCKEVGK